MNPGELDYALKSALRYAASYSVITTAQEQELLAALRAAEPAQVETLVHNSMSGDFDRRYALEPAQVGDADREAAKTFGSAWGFNSAQIHVIANLLVQGRAVAAAEIAGRLEYASGMFHDSTRWHDEDAPDGSGSLWDWVCGDHRKEGE